MRTLKSDSRASGGWLYPPLLPVVGARGATPPCMPAQVFALPPTHLISLSGSMDGPEAADFIIALIGFLDGVRLTREGWTHFLKVPLELGILGDLSCTSSEITSVLSVATATWLHASPEVRQRLFGAIHWLTFSALYEHDFERFAGSYIALDTLYWIHRQRGSRNDPHAARPSILAAHFGVPLPPWGVVSGGTCELALLRNALVHEGRYAGAPIGFAHPSENIAGELESFVRRLIIALLGIQCGYVRSSCTTRQVHGLDLIT